MESNQITKNNNNTFIDHFAIPTKRKRGNPKSKQIFIPKLVLPILLFLPYDHSVCAFWVKRFPYIDIIFNGNHFKNFNTCASIMHKHYLEKENRRGSTRNTTLFDKLMVFIPFDFSIRFSKFFSNSYQQNKNALNSKNNLNPRFTNNPIIVTPSDRLSKREKDYLLEQLSHFSQNNDGNTIGNDSNKVNSYILPTNKNIDDKNLGYFSFGTKLSHKRKLEVESFKKVAVKRKTLLTDEKTTSDEIELSVEDKKILQRVQKQDKKKEKEQYEKKEEEEEQLRNEEDEREEEEEEQHERRREGKYKDEDEYEKEEEEEIYQLDSEGSTTSDSEKEGIDYPFEIIYDDDDLDSMDYYDYEKRRFPKKRERCSTPSKRLENFETNQNKEEEEEEKECKYTCCSASSSKKLKLIKGDTNSNNNNNNNIPTSVCETKVNSIASMEAFSFTTRKFGECGICCMDSEKTLWNEFENRPLTIQEISTFPNQSGTLLSNDFVFINPCLNLQHLICVGCFRCSVLNRDNPPVNRKNAVVFCISTSSSNSSKNNNCTFHYELGWFSQWILTNIEISYLASLYERYKITGFEIVKCPLLVNQGSLVLKCGAGTLVSYHEVDRGQPGQVIVSCIQNPKCFGRFCYHCLAKISNPLEVKCFNCISLGERKIPQALNRYFYNPEYLSSGQRDFIQETASSHLLKNKDVTVEIAISQIEEILTMEKVTPRCGKCGHYMYKTSMCNEMPHCGMKKCYVCGRTSLSGAPLEHNHWDQLGKTGCAQFSTDPFWKTLSPPFLCTDKHCHQQDRDCDNPQHQAGIASFHQERKKTIVYSMIRSLSDEKRIQVLKALIEKYPNNFDNAHIEKKKLLSKIGESLGIQLDYTNFMSI